MSTVGKEAQVKARGFNAIIYRLARYCAVLFVSFYIRITISRMQNDFLILDE